jgi:peroxiredoxin
MLELGQLDSHHEEFAQRNARVVVVSIEDQKTAQDTQTAFPHLVVVADDQRGLVNALNVVHPGSDPHGGDTAAPTTVLVDGRGVVRWTFRPDRVFRRLSPAEVLAALDEHIPSS